MVPTLLVLGGVAGLAKMRLALTLIIAAIGWAIVVIASGGNVAGTVLVSLPNALVGWLLGRAIAWGATSVTHR